MSLESCALVWGGPGSGRAKVVGSLTGSDGSGGSGDSGGSGRSLETRVCVVKF